MAASPVLPLYICTWFCQGFWEPGYIPIRMDWIALIGIINISDQKLSTMVECMTFSPPAWKRTIEHKVYPLSHVPGLYPKLAPSIFVQFSMNSPLFNHSNVISMLISMLVDVHRQSTLSSGLLADFIKCQSWKFSMFHVQWSSFMVTW